MTTSLPPTDQYAERFTGVAAAMLAAPSVALELVGGGRNSRVYRVTVPPSSTFALKAYFRHPSDHRNRMETEFASLTFLRQNGIKCVPRPVHAHPGHGCAIYEWIEGRKMAPDEITAAAIDAAAGFLGRLSALRDLPGTESLPPASEACFSGEALLDNLSRRLEPLRGQTDHAGLVQFLADHLLPAFAQITAWSRRRLDRSLAAELTRQQRTLSPSDFGFHNALLRPSGEIVFLDLEYFGWDDPAKMICDFLLHPAMALPDSLKRRFATSLVRDLSSCPGLPDRVEAVYPLYGLKWCLILLNEFLPEQLLRRRFAGMSHDDRWQKQNEQLAKAQAMLQRILKDYEHFPYLH